MSREEIQQIWAEALFYVNKGEKLYLSQDEEIMAKNEQRDAMESDEREGLVREYLEKLLPEKWEDMLNATGMRVSELVQLNIRDIDFEKRECKVLGKGDKEQMTYFDAKTKLHLQQYLEQRTDDNEALFVGLIKPYERIGISAVERRVRKIGRNLNIKKCHPHKFRTTCATRAIAYIVFIE